MARLPDCKYLSVTKNADNNNGVTEFQCSVFKWIKSTFSTDSFGNIIAFNETLFDECKNCASKEEN